MHAENYIVNEWLIQQQQIISIFIFRLCDWIHCIYGTRDEMRNKAAAAANINNSNNIAHWILLRTKYPIRRLSSSLHSQFNQEYFLCECVFFFIIKTFLSFIHQASGANETIEIFNELDTNRTISLCHMNDEWKNCNAHTKCKKKCEVSTNEVDVQRVAHESSSNAMNITFQSFSSRGKQESSAQQQKIYSNLECK